MSNDLHVFFLDEAGNSRLFTFDRLKTEDLGTTVTRISTNVNKFLNKSLGNKIKRLRKKNPEEAAKVITVSKMYLAYSKMYCCV